MSNPKIIQITGNKEYHFNNQVDFCIGTGRMGLALTKEYQEQLALVQKEIGFSHIRGHGLFCDDMGIYQETPEGESEYNFTYLDRVMDSYISLGLRPFLELGFMPQKMASGTQTIFYWKGNTTPPASYKKWTDMVTALLSHLCERYTADEVVTWPIEVWNEPNLPGFWENADMPEYFKLFNETFDAIKKLDSRFLVGGPAVCGGTDEVWIRSFMEYCETNDLAVDFVTRHHYTSEPPKTQGHYSYIELMDPEEGFANLHTTREIIDSFPRFKGLPIHITEFNTSYVPNCPIHDTNQNAAYIAHQLSRLGDDNESYSYWTFGDVFEEFGVPFTPFHGGFGLVANGCIPKPTFWTFAFFKKLKEKKGICVYKDETCVVMKYEDGSYRGIAWNAVRSRSGKDLCLNLTIPTTQSASTDAYLFLTQTVDEDTCNPLKTWHDMGEPANPAKDQIDFLKQIARPQIHTERMVPVSMPELHISIELNIKENGVVYFVLEQKPLHPDRGYSYERVMQYEKR